MSQPVVEGSLGSPPFEKPNIEQVRLLSGSCTALMTCPVSCCSCMVRSLSMRQHGRTQSSFWHPPTVPSSPQGVLNFVQYKFSHLPPKERQTMYELSKMFLLCLNYWKLETPSQFRQRSQNDDVATYKVNYTR